MESRIEIEAKLFHVRVYTVHEHGYSSSFQLFTDGDVGVIFGLNGEDFMRVASKHIEQIFTDPGITRIFFHMMDSTLRALKYSLRHKCEFIELGTISKNGRELIFVSLALKK